jgi:hypothetical protein
VCIETFEALVLLLDPLSEPGPMFGQLCDWPSGGGGVVGVWSGVEGVVVDGGVLGAVCAQATAALPPNSTPDSAPATRKCLRDIGWLISIGSSCRVGLEPPPPT